MSFSWSQHASRPSRSEIVVDVWRAGCIGLPQEDRCSIRMLVDKSLSPDRCGIDLECSKIQPKAKPLRIDVQHQPRANWLSNC